MSENLIVGEYSLIEQVHIFAGVLDTFSTLYPQIQVFDFPAGGSSFSGIGRSSQRAPPF